VFQFVISIGLIVSTGVVYEQMSFASSKKLGFDKEHVLVVELTDPRPRTLYRTFRQRLEQDPDIIRVSASSSMPGGNLPDFQMKPATAAPDENWTVRGYMNDFDLAETLGLNVLAGRTQSPDFPVDSAQAIGSPNQPDNPVMSSIVINQTAVTDFGWSSAEQAVGKEVRFAGDNGRSFRVIGVVDDFHNASVHEPIGPTMLVYGNDQMYFYVFARIKPGDIPATITRVREAWNEILPEYAFEYTFLDERFAGLYRSDALVGSILGYFAILTILIACLGLFGLASFTAQQRTKEIGVRKTLGATVGGIMFLLSKEFTRLVTVAFVIAIPVALWAMNSWLSDFAYRIELIDTWWVVAAAGAGALVIALLTVSYQSARAAVTDPVEALRYE
jgi:putative ABC transport system permease protein